MLLSDGAEARDSSFSIQWHLSRCGAGHPTASPGACARGSRQPRRVRWELLALLCRRARAGAGRARGRAAAPQRAAVLGLSERSPASPGWAAAPGAVATALL